MGRHSCCVKQKLRKGLWSPEEDEKLFNHITRFGVGCWSSVPKLAGLQRCGKSCRLRWINYLRPDLKRGMFSQQEEDIILSLHEVLGNRWAQIAAQLPGRTDNEIKNFWNSCLKKKLLKQGIDPATHKPFTQHQIKHEINNNLETQTPLSLQNMHHFSNLASSNQSQVGSSPFLVSADSSYYDAAVLTEASRDEILMSMSNIKPHEWVDHLSYYESYTSHHQFHQYGTSSSSYGICSSMPSLTSSDQNNLSSAMREFSSDNNNNNSGSKISSSNNSSNMGGYVMENNNNNGGMLSWEGENKMVEASLFQFHANGIIKSEEQQLMNTTCSWQEAVQLQNHSSIDFNSYLLTSFSQDLTAATYDVFRHV